MATLDKFVIGLTGGIASGKSTVAGFFTDFNIDVVSADEVARYVMLPGSELLTRINQLFNAEFNSGNLLDPAGSLDRPKLRTIIFDNPIARKRLDELTHPVITEEILRRVQMTASDYVIAEIPLLVEANMHELVQRILVVEIDQESQIQRIMQRDSVSEIQAHKVLEAQLNNAQRSAYADDIIKNDGSLDKVKNQVGLLHGKYLNLSREHMKSPGLELY